MSTPLSGTLEPMSERQHIDGYLADSGQLMLAGMPAPPSPHERARAALRERFGVPPFTVLDARTGYWQERKRAWLALGIRSELGRSADLLGKGQAEQYEGERAEAVKAGAARVRNGAYGAQAKATEDGGLRYETTVGATSIFDPVLAEVAVRWWQPPGGGVLDPFAGGSVRGLVTSILGRSYHGIDLRGDQIAANYEQAEEVLTPEESQRATWQAGDTLEVLPTLTAAGYDGVLTCPPYYDLEVYSDDPADLANYTDEAFDEALCAVAAQTYRLCRDTSFSTWVVGDVRDKRTGAYRGLPAAVVAAHERAGWLLYNTAVLITATGSLAVRAGRIFQAGRKLGPGHQTVLVFFKGKQADIKARFGQVEMTDGSEQEKPE